MSLLRQRVVISLLIYNVLSALLFVGSTLVVAHYRSFGVQPAQMGLITTAAMISSVAGALASSRLSERLGPRRTVLLSTVGILLGLAGRALARNAVQAAAAQVWEYGWTAVGVPPLIVLLDHYVGSRIATALGITSAAFNLVGIGGAVLAARVVQWRGWPALFGLRALCYAVLGFALLLILPDAARPEPGAGAQRLSLMGTLRKAPGVAWVAAALLVGYTGTFGARLYAYDVQARFAADVVALSLFESTYNAVCSVCNVPAGWLADKWGRGRMTAIGFALCGLSWWGFAAAPSLPWAYAAFAVFSLGTVLSVFSYAWVLDVAPPELKARASSLHDSALYLGSGLGSALGGRAWQVFGARPSFAVAGVTGILSAALFLRSGRHEEKRVHPQINTDGE